MGERGGERAHCERGLRAPLPPFKANAHTHPDHPDQPAPRIGRQLGAILEHQARTELGEDVEHVAGRHGVCGRESRRDGGIDRCLERGVACFFLFFLFHFSVFGGPAPPRSARTHTLAHLNTMASGGLFRKFCLDDVSTQNNVKSSVQRAIRGEE